MRRTQPLPPAHDKCPGPGDRQGREPFVRLDRILEFAEHGIRREGAVLASDRFDEVADQLRSRFGWT